MDEITSLQNQIIKHKILYYKGHPEITDEEYDKLEDRLKELDPENPALKMVGTAITTNNKIKHDKKMLSLEKTYVKEDLEKWIDEKEVISTFKIDGTSCSLVYENGKLVMAKTRGDGEYGEDILANILWINEIPKFINEKNKIEVRGELFCTENNFFNLSNEMESLGLSRPFSQRNIVSGLIGRKENISLCRYISFFAFDLIQNFVKLQLEVEKYKVIRALNIKVPEITLHKGIKKITETIEEARKFMAEGDYLIDGLVFTYNNILLQEELGQTAHHPKFRISFKFQGVSKRTKIECIEWNVSRNGIVTPVARVSAIELSGAIVSRVTLHNYGMVKQFNLKKDDEIEVIRSGEVIPKFIGVIKDSGQKIEIPKFCPSCNSKLEIEEIRLRCINPNCRGRITETILNFISKIGIDDLSEKRLEELIKLNLVHDVDDLYKLTVDDLMKMDKSQAKLANKIYHNIQKTKKVDLVKFLSALGLSGGAINKCEKIVMAGFNTIQKIKDLTFDELVEVDSFADKSAEDFLQSLNEKKPLIDKLLNLGLKIEKSKFGEGVLSGNKICITGALSSKRSDVEKIIKENGGMVSSSVNKNTTFLITNEKQSDSSKFKSALKFKIPILSEEEFFNLIKSKV